MRKRILVLTVLLLVFSLCSCGKKAASVTDEEVHNFETASIQTAESIPVTTEYVEDTIDPEPEKCFVNLSGVKPFSEGVAWVEYIDPENNAKCVGVLNTDGMITTNEYLSSWGKMGENFSNGYSYINDISNNGGFAIIDKSGGITAQSPEDGTYYKILAGGDGVFFVYQQIRSMTENEDKYGFIDANGQWIIELTTENPLYYGYKNINSWEKLSYYYLGEHVFSAVARDRRDSRFTFFNVDSGTLGSWADQYLLRITDDNGTPNMYNGGAVILWDDDDVWGWDTEGKLVFEMKLSQSFWGSEVFCGDKLFFTGTKSFDSISANENGDTIKFNAMVISDGAFYDFYGNKVIDFSNYTVVVSDADGFYKFHNGIAAVKILGADGHYYVGFIGLDGNLLFEPVKIKNYGNAAGHSPYFDGALCINDNSSGDNVYSKHIVLKTDGTKHEFANGLGYFELYESLKFIDGYAWDNYHKFFIGTDGYCLQTYVGIS